jgi:hypothetical protein
MVFIIWFLRLIYLQICYTLAFCWSLRFLVANSNYIGLLVANSNYIGLSAADSNYIGLSAADSNYIGFLVASLVGRRFKLHRL